MNIKIRKLESKDKNYIEKITIWLYDWWAKEEGNSIDKVRYFVEHSICNDRIPQTYIALMDDKLVGMYQLSYVDLECRPDIYPWLCNVYVDKNYRNNGICDRMLKTVKENAKMMGINNLFLFTKHIGLYEKYGWRFIEEIETYCEEQHIQRLYKLEIE